jgi:hypothetical protein
MRFDLRAETLCALPLVILACLAFSHSIELMRYGRGRLCSFLIGVFLALYCVLPISQGRGYDVDVRALAPMYVSVLLLMLLSLDLRARHLQISAWIAALALALANLGLLHYELAPLDRTIGAYRALLRVVPERSSLLPVSGARNIGRHQAFLHAGAWATIDRGAITPYLFSGSTGEAMSYFRYLHVPQAPSIFWASRPGYRGPDCHQVDRDFAYVAIIGKVNLPCPTFIKVVQSSDGDLSILKRADIDDHRQSALGAAK